jgi:hypothetical protein
MKIFLMILLIMEISFGEAFLRLSEGSSDDGIFLDNFAMSFVYSFRLSMGDTNTDNFEKVTQPVAIWILFILCGLITNVVMLNILISIIGGSYERINNTKEPAKFKELVDLIRDNSYLNRPPFSWIYRSKEES